MSDSTEKPPVRENALATLGTIIHSEEKRDAIHLAVIPMQATVRVKPGQHVTAEGRPAEGKSGESALVGIVDPFLPRPAEPGEWFWLVIYPRQIRSLRHVWSHPAFPDASLAGEELGKWLDKAALNKDASEKWIKEWCLRPDNGAPSYHTLMAKVEESLKYGFDDNEYLHFDGRDAHGDIPPEFWDHASIVLGIPLPAGERPIYFSCSC